MGKSNVVAISTVAQSLPLNTIHLVFLFYARRKINRMYVDGLSYNI